jgi:hypothetical protein
MATSISTPASFSSVRTAFNAEGYGISDSLFAYRQGGGIVPATTPFDGIGAGTVGDPLQLSQFSGFSVPSLVTEVVNITNHSVFAERTGYGSSASSSFVRLALQTGGALALLGSTAYNPSFTGDGSIFIDGQEFFADDLPGSSSGNILPVNEWLQSGTPNLYSARATIVSGNAPNNVRTFRDGTFGSWVAISTAPEWSLTTNTSAGQGLIAITLVFTLDIALTSDLSTILDSSTITLQARSRSSAASSP